MKKKGLLLRLGRGLYQLPGSALDVNHSLAEAAKLVPKGVFALGTALAFYELTDTLPSGVLMAIDPKDRRPITRRFICAFQRQQARVPFGGTVLTSVAGEQPRSPQFMRITRLFRLPARKRCQPGFRFQRDRRLPAGARAIVQRGHRAFGHRPLDAALDRLAARALGPPRKTTSFPNNPAGCARSTRLAGSVRCRAITLNFSTSESPSGQFNRPLPYR
jgi:hypothetical protein